MSRNEIANIAKSKGQKAASDQKSRVPANHPDLMKISDDHGPFVMKSFLEGYDREICRQLTA